LLKRAAFSTARSPRIPDNVDALIGLAGVEAIEGVNSFVIDPVASFAAAEAKLTKALSSVPDHAIGHMWLGLVNIFTRRAVQGIAECEHALALDRNLASAGAAIGFGKILIGRAEETEAHIGEVLRLSLRDTTAYISLTHEGLAKNHLGSWEQAVAWCRRAIEAREHIFSWPWPSRSLIDLPRRIPQLRRVSRSTRPSPPPAPASIGRR
jgi:tetratricopeptide (TPR) repeat protein